ncbi:hypothetical protein DICPUDRAFT_98002 [Dictyostelium purpureum]|uniref:Chitinase II/V-like catalytic domain-containing protein n=1 Tax=Dictyostelium purpureum TaxID=5786 RepID=F0ZLS9_DICPU|nr:uncharacterized protein DICPUDRAFT_98002 [Dictyostelium purpureum]EGC35124.1 hypothetical protein DICPUDRAFT_98002 [Dictyostelium purpureum]|eukprot:XP_003288376.1 hypothetical protein DICPUDRAFT_98002 [Dictyostelium purpureum]
MTKNKIILIFFFLKIYVILAQIYKSCADCDCDDIIKCNDGTLCNGPIDGKTDQIKKSFIYISGNQQSNYTYFKDDYSLKWDAIDIIALYGRNYDKRISCLAHQKKVKVLFNYEETSFCNVFRDPNCTWDLNVIEKQLPRILTTLQDNNIDGINLDFEVGNRYGEEKQYAFLLKTINDYLKSKNKNYIVSSAIALRYRDNFKNQIVDVLENSDYLTIMAYDLNSLQKGSNFTQSPSSPITVRNDLKNFYIDRLPNQYLNKVILILPYYGYITKCKRNDNSSYYSNDDNGLLSNECIIDDFKPRQITYKEIDSLVHNKKNNIGININIIINNNNININENENNIVLSSGTLYDSKNLTPYSNLIDSNGDRWQITFDSPFSIYSKTISIGVGGVGCWSLDKIQGLPQSIVDSFYYSIKKENIGNNFILNPYY